MGATSRIRPTGGAGIAAVRDALDAGRSLSDLEAERLIRGDGGSDEDAARWLFAWAYTAIRTPQRRHHHHRLESYEHHR